MILSTLRIYWSPTPYFHPNFYHYFLPKSLDFPIFFQPEQIKIRLFLVARLIFIYFNLISPI
jgi:hypothetical protein